VNWFQRRTTRPQVFRPQVVDGNQPWLDKPITINGKPTSLRTVRKFAVDMSEVDYRNPAEQGLAMTIVALVDEISWLNAQLIDAKREKETT
jgi:hypothetical protein